MSASHLVHVMLGFHVNFYHSWRGDSPDEAGFGTDIRVIRGILDILERANAGGQTACGYWDWDVYWTLQQIVPRHAPDILERVRRRVQAGLDEIVLGPYNNGANHAATTEEYRTAISWAIENPFGSGLRQLFGQVAPILRPQEFMHTAGQNAILRELGVEAIILAYSAIPFNSISTFIPTLPLVQRFNPLSVRFQEDEPAITVLPCLSVPDFMEYGSLEALMLDLRGRQVSGEIDSDVAIHLNFDADNDAWLPAGFPKFLSWFPNSGGLEEYIRAVNRHPWAKFTLPAAYLSSHPPLAECVVRQDLADGGFEGNYSWSEKYTSLLNWTLLEESRLHTYRAMALLPQVKQGEDAPLRSRLWEGMDSSFFKRLVGLTTTHFGMSTPVINEERQAKAAAILEDARRTALEVEGQAANLGVPALPAAPGELYRFRLTLPAAPGLEGNTPALVRLPLLLPEGTAAVSVRRAGGEPVRASLVNVEALADGSRAGTLMFVQNLQPGEYCDFIVQPLHGDPPAVRISPGKLEDDHFSLRFSEEGGIEYLQHDKRLAGGPGFLEPFVTYRSERKPQRWAASGWKLELLEGETWDHCQRARLSASIPMQTPGGETTTRIEYTFTLLEGLPALLLDVDIRFGRTLSRDLVHNLEQKLRRWIDRRWVETAPCQLFPQLERTSRHPLRVWKHNFMGVTSYYDLDYGRINPNNKDWDSFNHHVTAGWVAVSDRRHGLMLCQGGEGLASMAFCPMRLREVDGKQYVWLNPFGSYFGRMPDFAHLEGNGIGAALTTAISGALHPNGPSYNGRRLKFSLLLAPYAGDEPPQALQTLAQSFYYPPGVVFQAASPGIPSRLPEDLEREVVSRRRTAAKASTEPLPAPLDFLVNPSHGAADLVWDEPDDLRIDGYEFQWRAAGAKNWSTSRVERTIRARVDGLENKRRYEFRLRSFGGEACSDWCAIQQVSPGTDTGVSLLQELPAVPLTVLVRLAWSGVRTAWRIRRSKL